MRAELNLFTHDGQFHADEVFATAMFSLIAESVQIRAYITAGGTPAR